MEGGFRNATDIEKEFLRGRVIYLCELFLCEPGNMVGTCRMRYSVRGVHENDV